MCPFLLYPSAAATFLFSLPDSFSFRENKEGARRASPRVSITKTPVSLFLSLSYLFEISLVSLYSLVQHVIER